MIYIDSVEGNDLNDGRSKDQAIQSLEKLNDMTLEPGTRVLFKRGSHLRGQLKPTSGTAGQPTYYGAYGEGNQPILNGATLLSETLDWQKVQGKLWRTSQPIDIEVGAIWFNDMTELGLKKWHVQGLEKDYDFYHSTLDQHVYMFCQENPSILYGSVELALNQTVIPFHHCHHIIFENLHITKGGGHGFQGTDAHNIVIRRCEISFIGGGACPGLTEVRYGNGIEFWGTNTHQLVEACYIHDIYDTAVTNQSHSGEAIQEHIVYNNNIFSHCGMYTIEVWNQGGQASSLKHIHFTHNLSLYPGCGWGTQRVDRHGYHLNYGNTSCDNMDIQVSDNVFCGGNGFLIADQVGEKLSGWWSSISMENNFYDKELVNKRPLWLINDHGQYVQSFDYETFDQYVQEFGWDQTSQLKAVDKQQINQALYDFDKKGGISDETIS